MKYTILGFSQSKALENGLDFTDLTLLRYFIDFKDTGKMSTLLKENKLYYWFKYDAFITEYPILSIKNDTVYRRMKKLVYKGFLEHITHKVGGTFSYYNVTSKIMILLSDSIPEGYGFKSGGGTDSNPEQNNPSTKEDPSTNNPNIYIPYQEIIDYLNKKANTNYRATGKKTKDLIKARLNEKFTLEDFKTVIDKKCNEWLNTKMENYLRPETLFSNKFESYLNQKEGKNVTSGNNQQDNGSKQNYDFSCFG
jgi:uncharacterized phage protein (TIGR02220 family)